LTGNEGTDYMARHNPESEDDFIRMQQEAIRRVREMQRRARATLENAGMHIENKDDPFPPPQAYPGYAREPETPHMPPVAPAPPQSADNPPAALAEQKKPEPVQKPASSVPRKSGINFSLDHDQLLLLAIILMLIQDSGDKWLLLSLAYVLI